MSVDYLMDAGVSARQLASLKPVQRWVVLLRFYLQMTPTEIAEVLELPVGTGESHVVV